MENNDNYHPETPIYYNYGIKNFLIKDPDLFNNHNEYSQIILCVYSINTTGKYPFIQYLLSNNGFNKFTLPKLPFYSSFNKETLIDYSKVFLSGILQINNFEEFSKNVDFDGYYEFDQNLYLFFNTTN